MAKMRVFLKNYLAWHYGAAPKKLLTVTDNFLRFFTRYFSVRILLATLFTPWHRVVETKMRRGWHPNEIFQRTVFNMVSVVIGALLRASVIAIWFLLGMETAVLGMAVIFLWLLLPGVTLPIYLGELNKPAVKKLALKKFVKQHSLAKETEKEAEGWFERRWRRKHRAFWHKESLFAIPSPTASWHYGYTTILDKYSKDLTEHVNILEDKIIGRDAEVAHLKRILCRDSQPAAILHGPTGSGRHAVVYELARQIQYSEANVPDTLKHFRVVKLDTASLFGQYADTARQRQLFETILYEAHKAGNIILVLDEIHMLTAHFDLLAPQVQRNSLKVIGLSTTKQFQRYLQKNEHARKIFENVEIHPLASRFVLRLLETKASKLEDKQNLIFPVETLQRIVDLGNKARTPQPDAALDLLDEIATASTKTRSSNKDQRFSRIMPAKVNQLAEEKLKIPLVALGSEEKRKLAHLENLIHKQVVNQDAAVNALSNAMRRARLELQSSKRPLGSFLFLGPTGVGKTETAKALAKIYFAAAKNRLLRFDMSNYQTKQDAGRLLLELADSITDQPYGVLLLDEIEKAHPEILNVFLTIIDEGYFFDLEGEEVSCRNLFIIGTSNAASEFIRRKLKNDLFTALDTGQYIADEVIEHVLRENIFSPEFINRFDAVIVFEPLGKPQLRQIVSMKLAKLNERLQKKYNTSIPITDDLIDQIIEQGYQAEFGARPINRAIQRIVEDPLAKQLLE